MGALQDEFKEIHEVQWCTVQTEMALGGFVLHVPPDTTKQRLVCKSFPPPLNVKLYT